MRQEGRKSEGEKMRVRRNKYALQPWSNTTTEQLSELTELSVRNFTSAAVSAATFCEQPRQAADAAHLLLLAGSQRRCSLDRAGALKVCLRSVEIFDWKD